jgi:hypothetical protein
VIRIRHIAHLLVVLASLIVASDYVGDGVQDVSRHVDRS